MKSSLLLLSAIAATTAGLGISGDALASEKLGEHPAVIVARTWNERGIDPNAFIVAHPARLQLISVSPTEKDAKLAQAKQPASTTAASGE